MSRRKIKLNVWRDPVPKEPGYLSPHCTSGTCKWCAERRRRAKARATAELEAKTAPGMFWDRTIDRGQEQLGPSAPDAWIHTHVKDIFGFWS